MNKKICKELISIAFPAMGENLLQMLMGMVDSYLVASLGIVALSGSIISVVGKSTMEIMEPFLV